MVWFPPTYEVVLDIIILIVSPARHDSWEVELSCVLERIASVAGAPWKKEEGSIVKPRCGVLHTVAGTVTRKPVANGMG